MPLRDWPTDQAPREKLLQHGSDSLSDAELLAILLRTGYQGTNAVELSQQLIARHGGLRQLIQLSMRQFCSERGLGKVSYLMLQAAMAVAQRVIHTQLQQGEQLCSPESASSFLRMQLAAEVREVFAVLFLDSANRLVHFRKMFFGSINAATVHPGEVLRLALEQRASRLIVAHNHPSGNCSPSQMDDRLTQRLANAAALVDIELLDHLVIGSGRVYSYAGNNPGLLAVNQA